MGRGPVAAVTAVFLLVVGCGGTDPEPPDDDPAPTEDVELDLSQRDLRRALIAADDIPRTHGTSFEAFSIDEDGLPRSDDLASGDSACGDYLDDEFGADPIEHADRAFADRASTVTVSSSIDLYAPGEADEELEEIRYLMSECDGFSMVQNGELIEVVTDLADLRTTDGYEDLGDDGLRVGLLIVRQGVPFRGTARTVIRVGDLIGSVAVEVPANFGRDPSPEMTALMDERLRDLIEETS